ncbi:MAG: bifunctional hydroxymethylpyrimidine kinase/phosphomethylpyrimidine kinase [Beijerinckiaceae bacterium]
MTPIAVTIAGSDSGGGAGIQADLKTFSALGVYGASVIVALTAQNTVGVQAIHDVPPDFVTQQMDSVFSDLAVTAVKIGMVSNAQSIAAIADGLMRHNQKNIVLDPVMVATSGDKLLAPAAMSALREKLIPRALIVTPNMPEAAALLDAPLAHSVADMIGQGQELLRLGAPYVLIKGGHGTSDTSTDVLVSSAGVQEFSVPRVMTQNTHGTGCTLSSAIAAELARGMTLHQAISAAKAYVTEALKHSHELRIGQGHGPVHHFYRWW